MPKLFGEMDASEVSDDPYYVAPDTYECVVDDAAFVAKKDQSGKGISIKYKIVDEDSEFFGNTVQEWKTIHPDVKKEDVTPEIRKQNSYVKQRLSQLGVPESEMNDLLEDMEALIGISCYVTVVESFSDDGEKRFTNVREVRLLD